MATTTLGAELRAKRKEKDAVIFDWIKKTVGPLCSWKVEQIKTPLPHYFVEDFVRICEICKEQELIITYEVTHREECEQIIERELCGNAKCRIFVTFKV